MTMATCDFFALMLPSGALSVFGRGEPPEWAAKKGGCERLAKMERVQQLEAELYLTREAWAEKVRADAAWKELFSRPAYRGRPDAATYERIVVAAELLGITIEVPLP